MAVLGASNSPDRYAFRAVVELLKLGHEVIPIHPKLGNVAGLDVVARLADVAGRVDTLTMYVGPALSDRLADEILAAKPGRVIFNPGAENPMLRERLAGAGIPSEEACTLVLLATDQF